MKEIKVETLSREVFYEFGSYSDLLHPDGVYLGDIPARFYRDRVTASYDPASLVAFGVNEIYPREKNTLEKTEHHFNTCEVLMPMDGDIIIHVGPARKEPVYISDTQRDAGLSASRCIPRRSLYSGSGDCSCDAGASGADVQEGLSFLFP